MENRNLEIVRYLVADKNMSLTEEKSLSLETTILNLEAALRRLPADADGAIPDLAQTNTADSIDFVPTQVPPEQVTSSESPIPFASVPQETSPTSTNGTANTAASVRESRDRTDDAVSSGSVEDAVSVVLANLFSGASRFYYWLTFLILLRVSALFVLPIQLIVSLLPVATKSAVCSAVLTLLDARSVPWIAPLFACTSRSYIRTRTKLEKNLFVNVI